MISQNKLFNNSWKDTFITPKLDWLNDDGEGKIYIRFLTSGSDFEMPKNLKDQLSKSEKIAGQFSTISTNEKIGATLQEAEELIYGFLSQTIKGVVNNPNNKNFDDGLVQTFNEYKKLSPEWIASIGNEGDFTNRGEIVMVYEVITNA